MKKTILFAAAIMALTAAACQRTEAGKAARDAYYADRPAHVTCTGYHGVLVDADSTGKVIYDEGGRVTFVDAATGRLVTSEGECAVTYFSDAKVSVDPTRAPDLSGKRQVAR